MPQPEDALDLPVPREPKPASRRPVQLRARRPPPLTIELILSWADHEYARTGRWPHSTDGRVLANRNENWRNIDNLLRLGLRGLPGSDSLPRLLARERGVRNLGELPDFTEAQIKAWAKAHRKATGAWPYNLLLCTTWGPVYGRFSEEETLTVPGIFEDLDAIIISVLQRYTWSSLSQ